MTYQTRIDTAHAAACTEHDAFMMAYAKATARASHSYFDQHIIQMDDGRHWCPSSAHLARISA